MLSLEQKDPLRLYDGLLSVWLACALKRSERVRPADRRPGTPVDLQFSECHAENHVEGERIRGGAVNRPVEAENKVGFYKVSVEETVLYRPTLDDQRRDPKLR
jgi:hypothetical protein